MKRETTSDLTLELNAWWRRQRKWKTKAAAAKALGIPSSTFNDYFAGGIPRQANRKKLYEATGLAILGSEESPAAEASSPVVDEADARLSDVSQTLRVLSEQFASLHEVFEQLKAREQPGRLVPLRKRGSAEEQAEEVSALIYRLIAVLDSFRASSADRDALRHHLHGPDVGYLASLATALLDEDRFQSWRSVSSYRPLGVSKDRSGS
jgi:hypothetical protein